MSLHTEEGGIMILIRHIKEDWCCRLPHRLRYNRYRGLSRPSYALLCFLYYCIKSVILLLLSILIHAYKFFLWDIWAFVYHKLHPDDEECDEDEKEELEDTEEESARGSAEDDLRFCQLFSVGENMCLLVDHIEMCPDETAFIRVVDDEGYTPLYKRRVRRDKNGSRYIVFNGTNHYLVDERTQPISIKK